MTTFHDQLTSLQPSLNRFAFSLTSNHEDAKDLTQETFLRALTFRQQFKDSSNLRAWTYTIMKNIFINNYRKHIHQKTYLDRTSDSFLLSQNVNSYDANPESMLREKEIVYAIDRLENDFKVPLSMYLQGYKYKEIAKVMEIKMGTIKSRIFFARKKLANDLHGYS